MSNSRLEIHINNQEEQQFITPAPTYHSRHSDVESESVHSSRGSVRQNQVEPEVELTTPVKHTSKEMADRGEFRRQHSQQQQMTSWQQQQQNNQEQPQAQEGQCKCCEILLMILSGFLILIFFPLSLLFCIKVVKQYQRAVIMRLGKVEGGPKGPGLFCIIPCIDTIIIVELRTMTYDVPPQEILTRDSVTVAVDAVVYYKIFDPIKSTLEIEDVHRGTQLLAQTTLRNILGTKSLGEILAQRDIISNAMQDNLDEATDGWGVKVERVEIKDVRLPTQMQRAMAAEAEATREARAKVIAAEGEQNASRALKEAADVINESPSALQLRFLQTLNTIAAEKNSTIVFPLPMELLSHLKKKSK